jgi:alginate O-acetyltransferase complex protein AlgI
LLFNTIEFFVFFAIVYALYRILNMRAQNRMLLLASYIFYGWWDVRFLYLVVLSTGLDYCCGLILGPGKIPARARAQVSACLILAALVFVFVRWDAVRTSISPTRTLGSIQQAPRPWWPPGWTVGSQPDDRQSNP